MRDDLHFDYENGQGELSRRRLTQWTEVGHYVKGFCQDKGKVLTFRKDRIRAYLDGCDQLLMSPNEGPPPKPSPRAPSDLRPQVLFTGFAKVQRGVLEQKSDAAGLRVVQSVTQRLAFLCAGPNAGPAKVEKAREQNVYIVTEPELLRLLKTGELPDSAVEALY